MEFLESIDEHEYTEFVSNHSYSHFLKSYEWGQVSKHRGLIPYYVGLKKNNKLVATALLLKKCLPLGYSYFYIPRGYTIDYKDNDLLKVFTEKIKFFTKKHKSLFFKIDPDIYLHHIDEQANVITELDNNYELVESLKKVGFKRKKLTKFFENMQPRFTFRVDLSEGMDIVRKRYSKSVNRWIKQADKYGIEVHVGTKENVNDFIELMKLTEKRQNFFSHEYSFYHEFYDLFKKNDYVDLLYATANRDYILETIDSDISKLNTSDDNIRYTKLLSMKEHFSNLKSSDRNVVSAYFNVNYGNKSWYLYGANDMDYKMTYANYKLFDFQIKNAKDNGKEIFDEFGTVGDPNTKKSIGGLHEFKKKFGGEYTEFIGEFDYITNRFMYFVFIKLVPFYRKPLKFIRHIRVKVQKGE